MDKRVIKSYLTEIIAACKLVQKNDPAAFIGSPEEELMHSLQGYLIWYSSNPDKDGKNSENSSK